MTTEPTITYTVIKLSGDASRPYAVTLPEGFINRIKGRYATKAAAHRAARGFADRLK
jgi:hypothetical protein